VREAGKPEPVDADTVFQLASSSKPISSSVVAAIVNDGETVTWDTRIADNDPSFQLFDAYPSQQVTIRDLFAHRSGLPGNAGNDLEALGYDRDTILHRLRLVPQGGVAVIPRLREKWNRSQLDSPTLLARLAEFCDKAKGQPEADRIKHFKRVAKVIDALAEDESVKIDALDAAIAKVAPAVEMKPKPKRTSVRGDRLAALERRASSAAQPQPKPEKVEGVDYTLREDNYGFQHREPPSSPTSEPPQAAVTPAATPAAVRPNGDAAPVSRQSKASPEWLIFSAISWIEDKIADGADVTVDELQELLDLLREAKASDQTVAEPVPDELALS
jgi:hypothetical protein